VIYYVALYHVDTPGHINTVVEPMCVERERFGVVEPLGNVRGTHYVRIAMSMPTIIEPSWQKKTEPNDK
jgi:hypothetical protein